MDMHQLIASQVTSYKLQVTKKAITDRLVGCVPAVLIRPTENH